MSSSDPSYTIVPPFENTDNARRAYILNRVAGRPVPPPPAYAHGEQPYDLIAAWIRDDSDPLSAVMRLDVLELLRQALDRAAATAPAGGEARELGGLLAVVAALRDTKAGEMVAAFVAGAFANGLSDPFLALQDMDGLYGSLGRLMFDVIDRTSLGHAVGLLERGIDQAPTAADAAERLVGLARRDASRGERMGELVLKQAYAEGDKGAFDYGLRILHELCWGSDARRTDENLWEWFPDADVALRRFLAERVMAALPAGRGEIGALFFKTPGARRPDPRVYENGRKAACWVQP
jgi:hypothetical protein